MTNLMKNFTLATINTINEKCVNWSCAIENFSESINFSPWPSRNWSTTRLGKGECPHPFEQKSYQKFQNKAYRQFFPRKFLKTGVVTL